MERFQWQFYLKNMLAFSLVSVYVRVMLFNLMFHERFYANDRQNILTHAIGSTQLNLHCIVSSHVLSSLSLVYSHEK